MPSIIVIKVVFDQHDEKISKLKLREGQLLEETIAVNEQLEQVEQKDAEIATLRYAC